MIFLKCSFFLAKFSHHESFFAGGGLQGQLGNGDDGISDTPVAVSGNLEFSKITASIGGGHICSVLQNSSALCWGALVEASLWSASVVACNVFSFRCVQLRTLNPYGRVLVFDVMSFLLLLQGLEKAGSSAMELMQAPTSLLP